MKHCRLVYLDVDGNPSSIYYDTLKKHGEEAAARAYVSYMLGTGVKFSQSQKFGRTPVEDIIKEAEDLILSNDETVYVSKHSKDEYMRITDVVKKLKMEPDAERISLVPKPAFDAIAESERIARKEIEDIVVKASDSKVSAADPVKLEDAVNKYLEEHPEISISAKAEVIRSKWEASAHWGDFFHATFQEFFTLKQDPENAERSNSSIAGEAINKAVDRFPDIDPKDIRGNLVTAVNQVEAFMKKIVHEEKLQYGEEPVLTMAPELKLRSKTFEQNVAGTSDLVVFSNFGNAYVFDFKSKTKESAEHMFLQLKSKFGGPFINEGLSDNAANSARVQTAYYAAILEEHGYRVPATYTVMLEGDLQRNENDSWRFLSLNKPQIITNSTLQHLLVGDQTERMERLNAYRASGIEGFIDEASTDGDYHNMHYVSDKEDDFVRRKRLGELTDKNGRRYIFRQNPFLTTDESLLYVDDKSEEEIDTILRKDYQISKEDRLTIAKDVIQYFEDAGVIHGTHKLHGREEITGKLLSGISKETHTLMTADRYNPAIGDAGRDVLVAVNKKTGAVSLFSVITAPRSIVQFKETGDKRSTIFGKYATDRAMKIEKLSSEILSDTSSHDFNALKLGLVALKLKNLSPRPLLIENMKVASIMAGKNGSVTTTYIAKEIEKLKLLNKYMSDDMKQKYKFVNDLLSKPSNVANDSYGMGAVEYLQRMILDATGTFKYATTEKEIGRIVSERLQRLSIGQVVPESLISDLIKFRKELEAILIARKETILGNPDLLAVDKALVQLAKFNPYSKQIMRGLLSKNFLRTAMTSGDAFAERAQVLYNSAAARIREEFKDFDVTHRDLLEKFVKESARMGYSNVEDAFKSLYEDPNFTDGNQANWMKLKKEDDPTLDTRPAAKEYIKFFNQMVEDQFKRSMPTTMFDRVKNGVTWTKGQVPIIRANKSLSSAKVWKSVDTAKDAIIANVKAMEKPGFDPQISNTYDFTGMEKFISQATTSGVDERNKLMGVSGAFKVVPSRDLETNLAAVLTNMVVTASESEHMGNTLLLIDGSLMHVLSDIEKYNTDINIEDTKKYLQAWTAMVISNKYGEDTKDFLPKAMDSISKLSSTMYFSGSLRQAATEFMTGTFQTASSMIANTITGALSGGEANRFWPTDLTYVASCLDGKFDVNMQSKMFQIAFDLGMTYADPAQLKQKEFYDTGKAKLFRSKPLFYLNQLFFNTSITNTALAEMHHKKIDEAYVNVGTKEKPIWRYDETLDSRFYVYDPAGTSYGKNTRTQPPQTEAEKKAYALWKSVRKELIEEGMVDEEGRMKVPLTANERTAIKYYATKLYGSFNKDKTKREEQWAVGRAMLRYKDWFAQRIANYYTPTDMSIARGKFEWIEDPELEDGGYYQWKGLPNEGIIESVSNLLKEIAEYRKIPKPTEVQMENLGKLLSDALMLLLLMWPISALIRDNKDSKFLTSNIGKSLTGAYTNAMSDIAIWKSMATMGDSMFPGIQMAATAVGDGFRSAFALATGDEENALKLFVKVPEKIGFYNSLASMYDAVNQ